MNSTSLIRRDDDAGRLGPMFAERRAHPNTGRQRSPVSHEFAALAFYVNGCSRIEQRDTWTLEPGDVLVVPAGEPHRLIEGRKPEFWRLGFCVPCVAADTSAALLEPFERVRDGASPVVRIPRDRHAFLESLFREMSVISSGTGDAAPVRHSLLTLIVNEVARVGLATVQSSQPNIVSETLRFIERRCLTPLSLNDIATAMNRTPSYITTALTRATGRSAVAWIIAGRMAEARRRLLHSNEPVEAIAERVGYADATHFIRLFRRTHGATPARWRAMQHSLIGSR